MSECPVRRRPVRRRLVRRRPVRRRLVRRRPVRRSLASMSDIGPTTSGSATLGSTRRRTASVRCGGRGAAKLGKASALAVGFQLVPKGVSKPGASFFADSKNGQTALFEQSGIASERPFPSVLRMSLRFHSVLCKTMEKFADIIQYISHSVAKADFALLHIFVHMINIKTCTAQIYSVILYCR